MSDDDEVMDDAVQAAEDAIDEALDDATDAYADPEDALAAEHAEALAEARAERLARQAYLFGVDKQLFTFLFANCLFVAGALACWGRAPAWLDGHPVRDGLDTIRGALIFGIGLYGFWTAYFNIYGGQMKVWPYLLNAILGLWAGIGGIAGAMKGPMWDEAAKYLKTPGLSKNKLDDLTIQLSVIAPGYWLITLASMLVLWVILSGLRKGRSSAKAESAASGGRRRR